MAIELPIAKLDTYAASFRGPHLELVVASIGTGNTAAQLWEMPQPDADPLVLLWDQGNNVFYLAGQLIATPAQLGLERLIQTHIRRLVSAAGATHFKIRGLSPLLDEALAQIRVATGLTELYTLFYGFEKAQPHAIPAPAVEDIRFARIDRAFLTSATLANIEPIRAEIRWMWPSEERFATHGFGYAAMVQERVICWCTAEYVSAQRCGVGIETVPEYERRGVATATAARFIADAIRRGVTPYWECRRENIGSIRVAEKLGFERLSEERFWIGSVTT